MAIAKARSGTFTNTPSTTVNVAEPNSLNCTVPCKGRANPKRRAAGLLVMRAIVAPRRAVAHRIVRRKIAPTSGNPSGPFEREESVCVAPLAIMLTLSSALRSLPGSVQTLLVLISLSSLLAAKHCLQPASIRPKCASVQFVVFAGAAAGGLRGALLGGTRLFSRMYVTMLP